MGNKPSRIKSADYKVWIIDLKTRLRAVQLKAAVSVNSALLEFYWELGADIVEKQKNSTWGSGFLQQLNQDLMAEFPEMKGLSYRNLKYIRQWYQFYFEDSAIGQQAVAQLENPSLSEIIQIPWGHNLAIVSKCQSKTEALYYIEKTIRHGWSRNVLVHQMENKLWMREGDQPTIGLLLCKKSDRLMAEWALSDVNKPIGISEYQLTHELPDEIQSSLPSIEQIEAELMGNE